jgi:hypothetical protein
MASGERIVTVTLEDSEVIGEIERACRRSCVAPAQLELAAKAPPPDSSRVPTIEPSVARHPLPSAYPTSPRAGSPRGPLLSEG